MKKYTKSFTLAAVLGALAMFSGCTTESRDVYGATTANYMGVYSQTERDFTPSGPNTLPVSTRDLGIEENVSGNQKKLLFGLITYSDY